MYNYPLNVNLSICLKIYTEVIQKIPDVEGRILPDDICLDTSIVELLFTKSGNAIPFMTVNITTAQVQLERYHFNVSIIGTLNEIENQNVHFADVLIEGIINDYKNLKPCIKEGIVHSISHGESNRIASRSFEVKYRMFDRMYEADENYEYGIEESEIADSVLPYIISMEEIYSSIYQTVRHQKKK